MLVMALVTAWICYAALQVPKINQCRGREVGIGEGLNLIRHASLIFAGNIEPETHYNHTIFVDPKKIYKATSNRGFRSDLFALQVVDSQGDNRITALKDGKTAQTVGNETYLFTILSNRYFQNKNMLDCFRYPFLLRFLLELRPQTLLSPRQYMIFVCHENGGQWLEKSGSTRMWPGCGMPTSDYQKTCLMRSECEGECWYDEKVGKKMCSKYKTEAF